MVEKNILEIRGRGPKIDPSGTPLQSVMPLTSLVFLILSICKRKRLASLLRIPELILKVSTKYSIQVNFNASSERLGKEVIVT